MCACARRPGVLGVVLCRFSIVRITCLGLLRSGVCGPRRARVTAGSRVVPANDVPVLTFLVPVEVRGFCGLIRGPASLSTALCSVPQQQQGLNSTETSSAALQYTHFCGDMTLRMNPLSKSFHFLCCSSTSAHSAWLHTVRFSTKSTVPFLTTCSAGVPSAEGSYDYVNVGLLTL